jgi:hypothetical protein
MREDWSKLADLLAQFVTAFMAESTGMEQELSIAERARLDRACLRAIETSAQGILAIRTGGINQRTVHGIVVEAAEMMDYLGSSWRFRRVGTSKWNSLRSATREEAFEAAKSIIEGGLVDGCPA